MFVAGAHDGDSISKTAHLRIVMDGLGIFESLPDFLVLWIDNARFFPIVRKIVLDSVLLYFTSCRVHVVTWGRGDLKDLFLLYYWRTGEVNPEAEKLIHECEL